MSETNNDIFKKKGNCNTCKHGGPEKDHMCYCSHYHKKMDAVTRICYHFKTK